MKALSIKQPWANLIAHGIKDIENRTWRTHFRGRIYIHASAKIADVDFTMEQTAELFSNEIWNPETGFIKEISVVSAIVGEVDIIDCVINHASIWAEKSCEVTIYNWVLANPVLYEKPILNVKGKLSFWETDLQKCESCELPFDPDTMLADGDSNWFCKPCYDELSPIWQQEYRELVEKGEIEPD